MPHVVIEYSANLEDVLDPQALVDDLHAVAVASGLAELAGIRSRAQRREAFRVAGGEPANGFVHITARLRRGRSVGQRKALGDALFAAADRRLTPVYDRHPVAMTIEVHEIDPDMTWRRNTIRESKEQGA